MSNEGNTLLFVGRVVWSFQLDLSRAILRLFLLSLPLAAAATAIALYLLHADAATAFKLVLTPVASLYLIVHLAATFGRSPGPRPRKPLVSPALPFSLGVLAGLAMVASAPVYALLSLKEWRGGLAIGTALLIGSWAALVLISALRNRRTTQPQDALEDAPEHPIDSILRIVRAPRLSRLLQAPHPHSPRPASR